MTASPTTWTARQPLPVPALRCGDELAAFRIFGRLDEIVPGEVEVPSMEATRSICDRAPGHHGPHRGPDAFDGGSIEWPR